MLTCTEQTTGKTSHRLSSNAATNIPPIQESSGTIVSANEDELDSPLDRSIKDAFPCLVVDESIKESLRFKLLRQSREINRKFGSLCTSTFRSLEKQNVSMYGLVVCITGDESIESFSNSPNKSIIGDKKHELFGAKNIGQVWAIASDYFSYFNYYLIEQIVEHFGTDEDKQNFTEYKKSFAEYAEQRVCDSPAEYGIQNETDCVIIVKLESLKYHHCTVTVSQLESFIDELSEIFKLTQHRVLRLCRVLPGCIELTLLAPSFVESATFPLAPDQKTALKALGVSHLNCGLYTYFSEV